MAEDEVREQLAAIRAVLAQTADIQREHAAHLRDVDAAHREHAAHLRDVDAAHREHTADLRQIEAAHREHTAQLREIDAVLAEIGEIQRRQAKELFSHAKLLAEHDERMERIGRHLEVLIDIVDGMVRDKRKPE